MAEQANAAKESPAPAPSTSSGSGKSQGLLIGLAIINMVSIGVVGFLLWKGRQKEAKEPKIEHVIKGEHDAQQKSNEDNSSTVKPVVPLETFIVNLSGAKGRRVARVNIELEVSDSKLVIELDQRKAQIRDIIIILLSGKTYEQISASDGRNLLREEIKDTVNAFLTKGKIENVFFTDMVFN